MQTVKLADTAQQHATRAGALNVPGADTAKMVARVSQCTAFPHLGDLLESAPNEEIFTNPQNERTRDYITGRFG
jgi:ABC-type phosphate transport system ATPase subunit